jgi:hypothetical protein
MHRLFTLSVAAALVAGCSTSKPSSMSNNQNTAAAQADKDGWIALFDGQTTNGWHSYGSTTAGKAWRAVDGAIHFDPEAKKTLGNKEGGDLVTNEAYDNFHLSLDWKVAPNANSGIIFYVQDNPQKYNATYMTGPEMQVLDNGGHPDAKIHKHRAGDLYDLIASSKEPVKAVGEWNHVEIISNKGKLDFYLNGEHIVNTTMWDDNWRNLIANSKFKSWEGFGAFKSGHIALQDHGDAVWFRDIKIKRL